MLVGSDLTENIRPMDFSKTCVSGSISACGQLITSYIFIPCLSPLQNTSTMVTWFLPTAHILAPQSPQKQKAAALAAVLAATKVTVEYYSCHYLKQAKNTSKLTGQQWLDELLKGHSQ